MIVPTSRLLFIAAVLILPAAMLAGIRPGFAGPCAGLMAICAGASAIDAVFGRRRIGTIDAQTPQLQRITKDVPTTLTVTLENRSTRSLAVRAGIVMPEGVQSERITECITLIPGKSALPWPCTGTKRGNHLLNELHVETPSPLGLWLTRTRLKVHCDFRVYPNLRDRATAALFLRTASPGVRLRRQVGKGREFERLREYIQGDSYEDIHWKATAKRRFPVVKLYQLEHAQEVYLVIDSSRLSAREGILDSYVNAALHLALAAERQGDRFGLITFSDRTHRLVRAHNGMDHFRLCREEIYGLHSQRVSPDFREVFTSIQLNLRRRSLLIFFTSLDDPLLAETFEREVSLLSRRHVVLVNVMETAGVKPLFEGDVAAGLESVYNRLAGQMHRNKMRELQISLQNRGVRLSIVAPATIKARATSAYLDIKRRQIL